MAFRVALGWSLFAGSHLALSHPPNRKAVIERVGQENFTKIYAALSLATFIPTTILYARASNSYRLYDFSGSFIMRFLGGSTKTLGLVCFGQSLVCPSATGAKNPEIIAKMKENQEPEVRGMSRITRHPLFMSFALMGLGNLLTRGRMVDIVYWGSFPAFWLVGSMHQDMRQRETLPESYYEKTSLLPFQAIYEGRNSWPEFVKELDGKVLAITLLAPIFFLM